MKPVQRSICLLIFCTCLFVYLANGQALTSNDDIANSLLAFNWLENQELNFDIFRESSLYTNRINLEAESPYFFIEAKNGHVSSPYPIGPAIVTFPIYVSFFLYLKLQAWLSLLGTNAIDSINYSIQPLDLTSETFLRNDRRQFDTLAASIITSLSAVLFYLASSLKFNRVTAIVSTFVYAFATSTWVVCSQGIRQNTISNVVVIATLLAILKANRSQGTVKILLLITAGFFCGLLPGSRPTSLVFLVPFVIYAIVVYRQQAIFFGLGLFSILFNIAWNVYYFGFGSAFSGGYSDHFGQSPYGLRNVPEAIVGLLFSPNRGLIALCPVLLFAIPGVRHIARWRAEHEEKLLAGLTISCLILYVHYWFYTRWPGIFVYGPSRFLIDTIPVLCFLINYFLYQHFSQVNQGKRGLFRRSFIVFLITLCISTYVQLIGAFGDHTWNRTPTPQKTRIWDVQDNIVTRTSWEVYHKIFPVTTDVNAYQQGLAGKIESVHDRDGKILADLEQVRAGQEALLYATLRNTGSSTWFGYDVGPGSQFVQSVRVSFVDEQDQVFTVNGIRGSLFLQGMVEPNAEGMALGVIRYPRQPGHYRMNFRLRLADNSIEEEQYSLKIIVTPRGKAAAGQE